MRKRYISKVGFIVITVLIGLLALPNLPSAKETAREWVLVNPEGAIEKVKPMQLAPRLSSLEGKNIALRWNGKPNGDIFLDRIAELLSKQVPSAKIIKLWKVIPEIKGYANSAEVGKALIKEITKLKPDIVIAAQAD
jgi:hypothetical protein